MDDNKEENTVKGKMKIPLPSFEAAAFFAKGESVLLTCSPDGCFHVKSPDGKKTTFAGPDEVEITEEGKGENYGVPS